MFKFRVEMSAGQEQREVEADRFTEAGGWLIFYRRPPQGGMLEYWRVRIDHVVCMETVKR